MCIYATDGFGNRCDFTPTENPRSDNFSLLGQAVKSCWPPHLGRGDEVRKSRTSMATPIAAGVAAIILEYIGKNLPSLSKDDAAIYSRLRTTADMKTVFRRMVPQKRGGYDHIVDLEILDFRHGLESATVCDIVLQDLRKYT